MVDPGRGRSEVGWMADLGARMPVLEHGGGFDRPAAEEVGFPELDPDALGMPLLVARESVLELALFANDPTEVRLGSLKLLFELLEAFETSQDLSAFVPVEDR
jgi:hypothetical protein